MLYLKKYGVIGVVLVVVALSVLFYNPEEPQAIDDYTEPTTTHEQTYYYVDIKGEIENPGVYRIEEGMRLFQVVELAGGLTEIANSKVINLSMLLKDEDVIIIPSIHDVVEVKEDPITNPDDSLLNINRASQSQLETLPGIGPSTALKIIEYREITEFDTIEDIMNVSGIGESTFNKIKDLITV